MKPEPKPEPPRLRVFKLRLENKKRRNLPLGVSATIRRGSSHEKTGDENDR